MTVYLNVRVQPLVLSEYCWLRQGVLLPFRFKETYLLCGGSGDSGSFTVLDSAGGRKNKMADELDMFSVLLRFLESDWFD